MSITVDSLLVLIPRVLGVAVAAFLAVFALDALAEGASWSQAMSSLGVHLMPSLIVLAIVVMAWRRPIAGGVALLGLAAFYAWLVPQRRLDWILAIAAPLAAVGVMFLWSGLRRRRPRIAA